MWNCEVGKLWKYEKVNWAKCKNIELYDVTNSKGENEQMAKLRNKKIWSCKIMKIVKMWKFENVKKGKC